VHKAWDYGVNSANHAGPWSRLAMMKHQKDATSGQGPASLNSARSARTPSVRRAATDEDALIRLGQRPLEEGAAGRTARRGVLHRLATSMKTQTIALLCIDIMDMIGTDYQVMGGPTHCCGTRRNCAPAIIERSAAWQQHINKLSQSKSGQVLAWCPSCVMQFSEKPCCRTIERPRRNAVDLMRSCAFPRHLDELGRSSKTAST